MITRVVFLVMQRFILDLFPVRFTTSWNLLSKYSLRYILSQWTDINEVSVKNLARKYFLNSWLMPDTNYIKFSILWWEKEKKENNFYLNSILVKEKGLYPDQVPIQWHLNKLRYCMFRIQSLACLTLRDVLIVKTALRRVGMISLCKVVRSQRILFYTDCFLHSTCIGSTAPKRHMLWLLARRLLKIPRTFRGILLINQRPTIFFSCP